MENKSHIELIINKKKKMNKEDLDYIVHKSTNRIDILTMNYIEKSIINRSGPSFVEKSQNKIEVITNLLLDDKIDTLYEFYLRSFEGYMEMTGNSFEGITSFNLVFITLIHISLKIIRKSVIKK